MSPSSSPILFREEQRWRDVWWVMLLVFGIAAIQWYGLIQQIILGQQFGNNPAPDILLILIWLLFGIGLPIFFLILRLVVEVHPEAVAIRYWPLFTRVIPLAEIDGVEVIDYRPLGEFGGWGIRGWGRRVAYNVRGSRGIELTLIDDRKVLLGSQRAEELGTVIQTLRRGPD
jgi:hypothetical protein